MSEEEINLTDEERDALEQMGYGYPIEEEKQNIFSFFKRVIATKDTTRVSNLNDEELGLAKIPIRTLLELSGFCEKMGLSGLGNSFFQDSQIISDSALSKEGFLDKLAVTQKREIESKSKKRVANKGWFKKKTPEESFESS